MHRQSEIKLFRWQYLPYMSSQYGELRTTDGRDPLASLGHPSKFQRVSRLGFVTAPTSLNQRRSTKLRTFGRLLGWYTIYTWGLLPPNGILPGAKKLRPSLAFCYIGSVTARHSSSARQPKFAAWYKEWNYGTFAEGATYIGQGSHHLGHRPTAAFY